MATGSGSALTQLAGVIRRGLAESITGGLKPLMEALFGERYHKRHFQPSLLRDAYALASGEDEGVPYAGFIHPDNEPRGPYGGTSLVWFPTPESGSLIGFGVGTRGLSPDEGILMRPGHRRRIAAMRRYLARRNVEAWTKPDPAAINISVPKSVQSRFPGFERTFQRYGNEMYCNALVSQEESLAVEVVRAFLDLYAYERGWDVLQACKSEFQSFIEDLRTDLFRGVSASQVNDLLRRRRVVVLQGPPGTGKTRLADEVRRAHFDNHGITVQFHPAVTYEDFVVGLSPDASAGALRFGVRRGWLLEAAAQARDKPFLLVIDEVNRGDLGKVLGEAIYLFEAAEVGGPKRRVVRLPHAENGQDAFSLPENLYVLCTMNTADRSIAAMDLAVRRRFSFVSLPPDRSVVAAQGLPLATQFFDRLSDLFVEHAPEDGLDLLPGHSYFLAKDENVLRERFRHELIPLLDEYLRQGLLGPATSDLHAVRDALEDAVSA